jgi:hypothetical protein
MDRRLDVVLLRGAYMPQSLQGSDTQTNGMDALRRFLLPLPPGPVSEVEELGVLVAACWPAFDQNHTGGMKAEKLYGRMESVLWEPPLLACGFSDGYSCLRV